MNTAVCIASGPSLTREDVEYCKGKARIYAVKEAVLLAPWADVLYAADTDWWSEYPTRWENFAGEKWTCSESAAQKYGLNHIAAKTEKKWSRTQGETATGGNSGFQALNMAALHFEALGLNGEQRIILLGFDYGFDKNRTDKHWWDKKHPRDSRESNYADWNKRLQSAAPLIPVPVINASRESAITCFAKADIRSLL